MPRGSSAKEGFVNNLTKYFKDSYLGIHDKKYYFKAEEDGEELQLAISITCPKNLVDFGDAAKPQEDTPQTIDNVNFTPEEEETIEFLMKKLGL